MKQSFYYIKLPPKCILHILILISFFSTSHKHPTTTKILNNNTTQWKTHTMECCLSSRLPYTFTPTGIPPKGKLHIHTKYTQYPHTTTPRHTHTHAYNNNLITLIVDTNFIGTILHISYTHLKKSNYKTIHYYMWNSSTLILLARDVSPNLVHAYYILENMPKLFQQNTPNTIKKIPWH